MQWCDTYNEPLFIPMTSWLPNPHLPLVASMDGLDGANLIAPLQNNQHILCLFGLLDIAMYHVPSKKLLKLFSGKYIYNTKVTERSCSIVNNLRILFSAQFQTHKKCIRFLRLHVSTVFYQDIGVLFGA